MKRTQRGDKISATLRFWQYSFEKLLAEVNEFIQKQNKIFRGQDYFLQNFEAGLEGLGSLYECFRNILYSTTFTIRFSPYNRFLLIAHDIWILSNFPNKKFLFNHFIA